MVIAARRRFIGATLLALGVSVAAGFAQTKPVAPAPLRFEGTNTKIALSGPYDALHILVSDGLQDRSGETRFTVADPKIATVQDGFLRPRNDGTTTLTAHWKGATCSIPVVVKGIRNAPPPRFITDVVPVLTRNGCNMGGCHGAAQGKGGFKLSLQGYDPEADFETITRGASARRVSPAQPENSLLLRKPTLAVKHKGGNALIKGSPDYQLLVDWISAGMPAPQPTEPTVKNLEVFPPVRTAKIGQKQHYQVWATFSDGTRRDVSAVSLFSVNDGTVARITPDGEATVAGKGEAAVLVRYQDLVKAADLISPYAPPRAAKTDGLGPIDRRVEEKLASLGLNAAARCSDADYLRRVYLDVIGTLPTPDETRAFLTDTDPAKREKLAETLLARPEYVDYWTLKWGDIFRSTRNALNEKGLYSLNRWIRQSVTANKPWDQMARELVLARGSMYEDGPANYFRAASTPETLTEMTSQVFLGVRIQCARCHNHPYEKWKLNQYYQMAAFFARVKTKAGEAPDERIVFTSNSGEVTHPKTRQVVTPTALDSQPIPATFTGDRRTALASWLTAPENPFFARAIVNRVWRHFMGQGLIEPVDDLRVTNPASNSALLDWLAQDFIYHRYDLKYLMRTIIRTQAYQRSALPDKVSAAETRFYSHYYFKRLDAEPLLDAVGAATGVAEKFGGYPSEVRATQLPDAAAQSYFLDLFGRPARNIVCQCERLDAPNLGQILHFMNGKGINDRLASKTGRVAKLIEAKTPLPELVKELYLATFCRYPDYGEMMTAVTELHVAPDKQKAAEDLLWVLLNSKEFFFNH